MTTFSEFLISNGDLLLFEKSAFYKEVMKKLTPSEQMEFIEFVKKGDSTNIMKMVRSVHKKSNSLKGKRE